MESKHRSAARTPRSDVRRPVTKPSLLVVVGGGFIGLGALLWGCDGKKAATDPQAPAASAPAPMPAVPPARPLAPAKPASIGGLVEYIAKRDQSITYAHLKKSADRYAGQVVWMRGQILTIKEDGGQTQIQLNTSNKGYGLWDDQVIVAYGSTTPFVEKKLIRVAGKVVGNHTYTSQAGWQITVPLIRAEYVVPGGEEFLEEMSMARKLVARKGSTKAWDCILDGVDVLTDPQTLKSDPDRAKQYMTGCLATLGLDDLRPACEPAKVQQRKCARLCAGVITASAMRQECTYFSESISKECCKRGLCEKSAAATRQSAASPPSAKVSAEARPVPRVKGRPEAKRSEAAVTPSPTPEPKVESKPEPKPEPKPPAERKQNWGD
ncbi:MAG: hypothetical protein IT371_11885 [Deltaproteobacteria bacterium]|nr:hypothetical protein [Deltaproteobacteria bacterium]